MQLHNCRPRSWVVINETPTYPVGSVPIARGDIIFFFHCDGMYSLCKTAEEQIVHPAAWTEVGYLDTGGEKNG